MLAFASGHPVADLTAGPGRCSVERLNCGRKIMRFSFQGDDRIDIPDAEKIGFVLGLRGKFFQHRSFDKGNIIFISRYNPVRDSALDVFLMSEKSDSGCSFPSIIKVPLNILCRQCSELTWAKPYTSLSVRLRPSFRAAFHEVFHLIVAQGKSFLLIIGFDIFDIKNRIRLVLNGENRPGQVPCKAFAA